MSFLTVELLFRWGCGLSCWDWGLLCWSYVLFCFELGFVLLGLSSVLGDAAAIAARSVSGSSGAGAGLKRVESGECRSHHQVEGS